MTRPYLFLAAVFFLACDGAPRDVPMTGIGTPVDSLALPYTYISDAVHLGGNRWAFVAPNERVAVIADLDSDSFTVLGGPRPTEYQEPFAIFRAGDSLYVSDWGKRSLTVWSTDGAFGRAIPSASFVRGALPRARDSQGRFYSAVHPPPRADGSGSRDSAFIVMMSADFTRADTVGLLAPPDMAEVMGQSGGRRYTPRAMSGRDEWGVLPDGRIWIARINQNRIDRRSLDGKWRKGQPLPDRVLTVEEEDRQRFLLQFPEELRRDAAQTPFAIIKPAFEAGFADQAGYVWLVKSFSLYDSTRTAQVVDTAGRLTRQLEYRGFGRVAGTSGDRLLVAEMSDKGHRLLVYPVPAVQADLTALFPRHYPERPGVQAASTSAGRTEST